MNKLEDKVLRVCRVCGKEALIEEDLNDFSKNENMPYGRGTICKVCDSEKGKKYYRENVKEQK